MVGQVVIQVVAQLASGPEWSKLAFLSERAQINKPRLKRLRMNTGNDYSKMNNHSMWPSGLQRGLRWSGMI